MSFKTCEISLERLSRTFAANGVRLFPFIGRSVEYLGAAFLVVLFVHGPAEAEWRFAWQEASTGEFTCSASSGPVRVRSGPGKTESIVRLGVQGEGFMTLGNDSQPFDPGRLYETWIRVDDNRMVVRLSQSSDGRTLTFSEEDSITLHRQFETGSVVTVSMIFPSANDPVETRFPLDGYRAAAAQYKGCRGLLLSPGWLGLFMTEAPKDHERLSWIRENTPYQSPGIEIVTVDPRKEAQKNDLHPGDLIIGLNGRAAGEVKDLISAMKNLEVGSSVQLTVVRGRTCLQKTLTRPVKAVSDQE